MDFVVAAADVGSVDVDVFWFVELFGFDVDSGVVSNWNLLLGLKYSSGLLILVSLGEHHQVVSSMFWLVPSGVSSLLRATNGPRLKFPCCELFSIFSF